MQQTAVIEKIIFHNADNGYSVLKDKNGNTYTGYIFIKPESLEGAEIDFFGDFTTHPKFGRQFAFTTFRLKENDVVFFLKNFIGYARESAFIEMAKRYTHDEIVDIFRNTPEVLLEIKGIGKKLLRKMCNNFNKNYEIYSLSLFLSPYGVTPDFVKKIYNHFKKSNIDPKEAIEQNPYILCDIGGVGFKKIDAIALQMEHITEDSDFRLKEAVKYLLNQLISYKGDTVFSFDPFFEELSEIVNVNGYTLTQVRYKEILFALKNENRVEILYDKYITSPFFYKAEKEIHEILLAATNGVAMFHQEQIEEMITAIEEKRGFRFGEKQKEAILQATTKPSNVFVMAGYAGSGKTTTTKTIMDIFATIYNKNDIVGCALSGNAANRIKNVTGYNAYTIHTLLGYTGMGFGFNEENPLPYRLIVLDEASMVSVDIFYHLIKAIDFNETKLIVVGDNAQLPPVGAGEVFSDILEYADSIPKVILDKVYRQNENQVINVFAQEIRQGKPPADFTGKYEDFYFVKHDIPKYWKIRNSLTSQDREQNNQRILEAIKRLATRFVNSKAWQEIKKNPYLFITYTQIITPIKKGTLGRDRLNVELKNIFNPICQDDDIKITISKKENIFTFSINDKVIHLKNQTKPIFGNPLQSFEEVDEIYYIEDEEWDEYEDIAKTRVYNGQVGVITNILYEEDEDGGLIKIEKNIKDAYIEVFYPYEKYYTYYQVRDLKAEIIDLAYAITIHKSQGSEYSNVIIPVCMSHYFMLNNKILYTAITRGKKRVIVIGETYAFKAGCKRVDEAKRNTIYKVERLVKEGSLFLSV